MTAHAALAAGELAALAGPTTVKGYLAVYNPPVLCHAHVNDPGAAITYPLTALPIDGISDAGAWATVKTGSTFRVTNGGTGAVHYYRMRQPPDANYVYIMELSGGDTGLMPDRGSVGLWFVDNDLVEVFDRFDLFTALPFLSYSGGVFTYKEDFFTTGEYATAFSINLNTAPPPVANLGPHPCVWEDATYPGYGIVPLSVTYQNWGGASTYDYINWVLPTGGSFLSGNAHTATGIAKIPIGAHLIECQLGTGGGLFNVVSYYRVAHVFDLAGTTYAPIPITDITSDTSDRTGRRMSFTLNDNQLANFTNGSMATYFETDTWNGATAGDPSIAITGNTNQVPIGITSQEAAQSFQFGGGLITAFTFDLKANFGSPTGGITWELDADNGSATAPATVLATGTIATPTASATNTVSGLSVWSPAQRIWLRLKSTTGTAGAWEWAAAASSYAGGLLATSTDSGATWTTNVGFDLACSLTASGMVSAVTNFSGWLIRSESTGENGLRTGSFDLVGPSELLNKLGGYSANFTRAASPADWSELPAALANNIFLPWYLLRLRAPMITQLFDHNPYLPVPLADDTYYGFKSYTIQPGTLLSQVQALANATGCNYGHDSSGAAWVRRHPWLRTDSAVYPRDGSQTAAIDIPLPDPLVFRDTITAAKVSRFTVSREYRPSCRQVRGEGYYYYAAGSQDLPFMCVAPGTTPGQGTKETRVEAQTIWSVAVSANEILRYIGMNYIFENNPYPSISMEFPYNYDVIEPAQMYALATNIAATYMADGTAFTGSVAPATVSRRYGDGTKSVSVDGEGETWGSDAVAGW